MDEVVRLILIVFMVYRLARLVTLDSGPWKVFRKLRMNLGAYEVDDQGFPVSSWGEVVSCPYCMGVYLSLIALPLLLYPTFVGDMVVIWFGIAGLQAFIQSLYDRR